MLAHYPGSDVIKEKPKKAKPTHFLTTPTENLKPKSQNVFYCSAN